MTVTEIFNLVWTAITQGTLPLLGYWTYIFVAILVAIEGPGITILAALLASTGALDPVGVFIAASLGNLSADIGWYLLGYLGRRLPLLPVLVPVVGQVCRLQQLF